MEHYEILYLRKDDWQEPYECIGRIIGQRHFKRSHWWLSQKKAIELIEANTFGFFIKIRKEVLQIVVGVNATGQKYLKSERDTDTPNLLLSLPQRPEDLFPMDGEAYPCKKYHELHRRRWMKLRKPL